MLSIYLQMIDDYDDKNKFTRIYTAYKDLMQNVALSVTPYDSEKIVEKVAFAFVYGYNKNRMTVKNAMLNYVCNGTDEEPTTQPEATQPATEPETTEPAASEPENEDILIDEELQSESVNTDEEFMRTQRTYDSNGNYVTSEVNEAGNTTTYTNDNDGNVTSITDSNGNSTSYSYDVHSNLLSVTSGDSSNTYTYNSCNELSKITHNGFDYNYTYDNYGSIESVKVGSQALITYEYDGNGNVSKMTYGNGDYLGYTYDDYARITQVELNDTTTLASYVYNKKGQIAKFTDGKSGETTEYCYDCNGNALCKYLISSDGELLRVVDGETEKTTVNGSMRTITNGTDDNGDTYVKYGNAKVKSKSDDFGRTTQVSSKLGELPAYTVDYGYKAGSAANSTTNLVKTFTTKYNGTTLTDYEYVYDSNGNITEIKDNGTSIFEFTYDNLNELVTWHNKKTKAYYEYDYDKSGNVTEDRIYVYTDSFADKVKVATCRYGYTDSAWKDKLTSYNNQTITYDAIGNPLSYRDGMTMSWSGRELQSITKSSNEYSFTYNINGLRTKKSVNGTNTFYYYDDSNNLIGLKKEDTTVLFYYDSEGSVHSMKVGDNTYFYVKNLQGDIDKIIDENGNTVASYCYFAQGCVYSKSEDNSIKGLNPFRYRGYVYDEETGLYYLQSRYYDPQTGRFVNADDAAYADTYSGSPLSTNMFAYCENNAVNKVDKYGKASLSIPTLVATTSIGIGINNAAKSFAVQFYALALYNKIAYKKYDFSNIKPLIKAIMKSKALDKFIFKYGSSVNNIIVGLMKNHIKYKRFPRKIIKSKGKSMFSISFYDDSKDLYLSIGACYVSMELTRINKNNTSKAEKWKVTFHFYDKYNYEKWSETKKNKLTIFLNNYLGYLPQKVGLITPYVWVINYSYYLTCRISH